MLNNKFRDTSYSSVNSHLECTVNSQLEYTLRKVKWLNKNQEMKQI